MNVNDIPQYKCHKVVRAAKIIGVGRIGDNDAVALEGAFDDPCLILPYGWTYKHRPEHGGYLVAYDDGNLSYSPAAAFESGYSPLITEADDFPDVKELQEAGKYTSGADWALKAEIDLNAADFSDALMWLKEGKRVARAGWNAGGQWVELVKNSGLVFRSEITGESYSVSDGLILKNAQDMVVQWVPSIGDLMATDWQVIA